MFSKLKKNSSIRPKNGHFYRKKKYTNPYFRKKRNFLIKIPSYSWQWKIIILLILIAIICSIWLNFFTPIFNIKEITVKGAVKISAEEIKGFALEQINSIWGRGMNIFLFSKNDLIKKINEKYNIDNLRIEKKLPDKLIISFSEKQQSIVWFETEKYYYADVVGSIISEVDPLNISQKNIPLIDSRGDRKVIDKKIVISPNKIKFILDLFFEFKDKKHNFEIERFIIDNEEGTVGLKAVGGPIIYFNARNDLFEQINKLNAIINQKIKDDFLKKTYIDLRYGDKVYYR